MCYNMIVDTVNLLNQFEILVYELMHHHGCIALMSGKKVTEDAKQPCT